jgi:hypothetical protein
MGKMGNLDTFFGIAERSSFYGRLILKRILRIEDMRVCP